MKYLQNRLDKRSNVLEKFLHSQEKNINNLFNQVLNAIENSGKIILIGNGGSFSIAQHISAEFTGRFLKERKSLPSIVLGSNPSSFSAIANDYGYENSFSREFDSMASKNDILIAMSVSGKSSNILEVLKKCHQKKIKSFFLTGKKELNYNFKTTSIKVPSEETAIVQELHLIILHELCMYIDNKFS